MIKIPRKLKKKLKGNSKLRREYMLYVIRRGSWMSDRMKSITDFITQYNLTQKP